MSHSSPWRRRPPRWATAGRPLRNVERRREEKRETMLCVPRLAAMARVRCLAPSPARAAGACRAESVSWRQPRRHGHAPAAALPLNLGGPGGGVSCLGGPLLAGLRGARGRYDCWSRVLPPPPTHVAGLRGHRNSADTLRALLAPRARGLCSRKAGEAPPDGPPAPERREDGSVPGHGLFKFKELVSGERKVVFR